MLKISRARGNRVRVEAGVRPGSKSPKRSGIKVELGGPLKTPEPIRAAVRQAISNRLAGSDDSHVEHRFQARMLSIPPTHRLGLEVLVPEYPAERAGPSRQAAGSIDFLGVDGDSRLHIVETKVGGSEPTVLLQALDYWIWAEANRERLAEELGADRTLQTGLAVVILPAGEGAMLQRKNRHIADHLARSVPLRVYRAELGLGNDVRFRVLDRRTTNAQARFVDRMRAHTRSAAQLTPPTDAQDIGPLAGLLSNAAGAAEQVAAAGDLHAFVGAAHSSQRFALNLFGPLDEDGVRALLTPLFGSMRTVQLPAFEWSDPNDHLREATTTRPFKTQVDVFLRGTTLDRRSVGVLVEVKLTETGFGGCSHAEAAPPESRQICSQNGPFGNDSDRCWQLRNRENGERRRYDEVLHISTSTAASADSEVSSGCWFRHRNQPMRLAALAAALEEAGELDECLVALTAPAGHQSMHRRWRETAAMIDLDRFTTMTPERVIAVLGVDDQSELIRRYSLGPPAPAGLPMERRFSGGG